MAWVDILVIVILTLSFIGGLKEGIIKNLFSLITLIIAIALAGLYYHWLANILAFLPGTDWENFIGFFITSALISFILFLIFLLPRKLFQKAWGQGVFFRLFGGIINVLNVSIGMAVFVLILKAYPIIGWLQQSVVNSSVLAWLTANLSFVQVMLPQAFRNVIALIS